MEKEVYVRLVRRVFTAVLVLLLLLLFNVQVMAEDFAAVPAGLEQEAVEKAFSADSYAAVAAQLEAVARAEGRASADKMLYASFLKVDALYGESAGEAGSAAAESGAAVQSATEAGFGLSGGLWTVPAAAAVVFGLLLTGAVFYRRGMPGRRTVYKPMRKNKVRPLPYLRYTVQHTYR